MLIKSKLQLGFLCFILFIAGTFYYHSNHEFALTQRAMTEVSEGVHQGERASSFSLKTIEGNNFSLNAYKGQKIQLFFFTTWCHICSEQWGLIEAAQKEGLLKDIKVVAVNLTKEERSKDDVANYVESIPLENVEILLDEEGTVQNLYQIIGVPTTLLIDDSQVIDMRFHSLMPMDVMLKNPFFSNE